MRIRQTQKQQGQGRGRVQVLAQEHRKRSLSMREGVVLVLVRWVRKKTPPMQGLVQELWLFRLKKCHLQNLFLA